MARAVRFDSYGGVDVLKVEDVPRPSPGDGQVLVEVVSTSINPGEAKIRTGALDAMFPSTFPSGQGSDLAGRVAELGDGVTGFAVGDEVLGWTDDRAAEADFVIVPENQLTAKPPRVDWDVAGSLFVTGTTAYAVNRAMAPKPGETVVVTAAAGGVGSLTTQLALRDGARVLAVAGPANEDYLTGLGAEFIAYGDGLVDRLRAAAPDGVDVFLDNFGDGYVQVGLDLGVPKERVNTTVEFDAVQRLGVQSVGTAQASTIDVVAELARLCETGELQVRIAATYPLERVREAFTELASGHAHGKIVLRLR